jgi:hypothetical protein
MRILDKTLLRIALGFGAFFVFRIATEVGLLSARWRGDGVFFRWQVWLLACLFTIALRDLVSTLRCRACGERNVSTLRGLFTVGEVLCPPCRRVRVSSLLAANLIINEGIHDQGNQQD